MNSSKHEPFPGRWIGGLTLILGPLLLLAGVLLRSKFHFFFPDQLRANPSRSPLCPPFR